MYGVVGSFITIFEMLKERKNIIKLLSKWDQIGSKLDVWFICIFFLHFLCTIWKLRMVLRASSIESSTISK